MLTKKKNTIFDFIHNWELAMKECRNNELIADYKPLSLEPILTTFMRTFEKQDAEVFTLCDCLLYESCGIPCSHIFYVDTFSSRFHS
jgi:hypothetical protein